MDSTQAGKQPLSKEEFCARFVTEMTRGKRKTFSDGSSIEQYAKDTAPTYYETYLEDPEDLTPEEWVDADQDCWEIP